VQVKYSAVKFGWNVLQWLQARGNNFCAVQFALSVSAANILGEAAVVTIWFEKWQAAPLGLELSTDVRKTSSTEQSPSREATSCEATQELPSVSWKQIYYHVYKNPQPVLIVSQISPFDAIPSYLSEIHFNIIHLTTSSSFLFSLPGFLNNFAF
jgi:hypothetical protein